MQIMSKEGNTSIFFLLTESGKKVEREEMKRKRKIKVYKRLRILSSDQEMKIQKHLNMV